MPYVATYSELYYTGGKNYLEGGEKGFYQMTPRHTTVVRHVIEISCHVGTIPGAARQCGTLVLYFKVLFHTFSHIGHRASFDIELR